MKHIILSILLGFCFQLYAKDPDRHYPLSIAPESLQSLTVGVHEGVVQSSLELALHGDKEAGFLEDLLGDWSHVNHQWSVGIINNDFGTSSMYGGLYVYFKAFNAIGTGIKNIVYYDSSLPVGKNLKSELSYFAFYQFDKTSILFGNGAEYLSLYVGFKAKNFNIQEESMKEYLDKAFDKEIFSQQPVFGIYYSPDVSRSLAIGFEMDGFRSIHGKLFFNL